MRLFLASEAKHANSWPVLAQFVDETNGLAGKTIAYIVTAANGEEPFGSWRNSQTLAKLRAEDVKAIKIIELEDIAFAEIAASRGQTFDFSADVEPIHSRTQLVKVLAEADVIWVAGGFSGYLLYWMRRLQLDKKLPEILSGSNGVDTPSPVYVGSSAGSMVCAGPQTISEWYPGELEYGASAIPGLGLIDFQIFPHFQDEQLGYITQKWNESGDGKLYLLKDGEALVLQGDQLSMIGQPKVIEANEPLQTPEQT